MRTSHSIALAASVAVTAFFVGEPSTAYGAAQHPFSTTATVAHDPSVTDDAPPPTTEPETEQQPGRAEAWLAFDTPRLGTCYMSKRVGEDQAVVYCNRGFKRYLDARPECRADRKAKRNWWHTDYTVVTVKFRGRIYRGQQL